MNAFVVVVCRVYALSMAAPSRRLRLVTVCSRRLIVSATCVTCSVLVAVVLLLPLPDASVPGVSSEKTFLCSHPSLCLSTWGVVCLALMYVVQCYMVRKLGPWLPPPFTDCAVTTGATPAKNTANAAGALRNALTACNTLEGTKRFSGVVLISARNGQRTS